MNNRPITAQTIESLMARTVEIGECREWTGYQTNNTPQVSHEGKMIAVRRLLLLLMGREIQKGRFAATSCGCALCVNPNHIIVRNRVQQAQAMARASRKQEATRILRVTEHARAVKAKLNMDKAREIRLSSESGPVLSERYGVSRSIINRIKNGVAWRDYSNPFAGLMG